MASLTDIIQQQVASAAGNIEIPADLKDKVLGGLTDSIVGGFTKTATQPGGIEAIKSLVTGATSVENSPVTALAGNLFSNNILKNLNLGSLLSGKLLGLIPIILGGASKIIKDQNGDGKVDLTDIIMTLTGAGKKAASSGLGGSILKGVLGSILGKR